MYNSYNQKPGFESLDPEAKLGKPIGVAQPLQIQISRKKTKVEIKYQGYLEIYEICQPLITIKNAFRHRRSRS